MQNWGKEKRDSQEIANLCQCFGKGCRGVAAHPEKARPRGSPGPLTPLWVSGPETQRTSEVSEGWQFSHTACIWCLLKGKNSTAGRYVRLLLEKSLSVPHCKTHSFFRRRKEEKRSGLVVSLKAFLNNTGQVGPYVMYRHKKLWVAWARE